MAVTSLVLVRLVIIYETFNISFMIKFASKTRKLDSATRHITRFIYLA